MTTATVMINFDYNEIRTSEKTEIAKMAHTLYDNQRTANRQMVPWRNASRAVKREFTREAKQVLGYV